MAMAHLHPHVYMKFDEEVLLPAYIQKLIEEDMQLAQFMLHRSC